MPLLDRRERHRLRDTARLRVEQPVDLRERLVPARVRRHPVAALLPVVETVIALQRGDAVELAGLGGEIAEGPAQQLELDRQAVPLVEADEPAELASAQIACSAKKAPACCQRGQRSERH